MTRSKKKKKGGAPLLYGALTACQRQACLRANDDHKKH